MNFPQRAPKRTNAQKKADLAFIEHWIVQGYNDRQVTEKLNAERPYSLSMRQVRYDRVKVESIWKSEMLADVGALKRRELQELLKAQTEAWAAWEKSKLDAERKTMEKVEGGTEGGPRQKQSMTKEGQCGDVSYLRQIIAIQERRAKLLGLDAPAKSELSGPAGGPIPVEEVKKAPIDYDALSKLHGLLAGGAGTDSSQQPVDSAHPEPAASGVPGLVGA